MCLAIAKPAAARVYRKTLAMGFAQNPDGAGFAWYDDDAEMVWEQKGFFNFKDFWQAYRAHEHQNTLIHFRAATHGSVSPANCHPFRIADNVVMAHNGVLYSYTPLGKDERSDTKIFIDELVQPVMRMAIDPVAFIGSPQVLKLLRECVGGWNKLVFLTPNGFYFVNQRQGDWVNGVWYSSGDPSKKYQFSTIPTNYYGEEDAAYTGHSHKRGGGRGGFSNPHPYGTKEYDKWMKDKGYVRDGNAWVQESAVVRRTKVTDTRSASEFLDDDSVVDEHQKEEPEPSNGSRPRQSSEAQKSLQLALGTGEGEETEATGLHGWQVWLAAQQDLSTADRASLEKQLETYQHNRQAIQKAIEKTPEGSVLRDQLMKGVQDLDERERLAVELAQGGYQ